MMRGGVEAGLRWGILRISLGRSWCLVVRDATVELRGGRGSVLGLLS